MIKNILRPLLPLIMLIIASCAGAKINVRPISNFDSEKYLGDWYEIARLDNYFEKGCENAKANYSKRDDGGIDVINSCKIKDKEKVANGRAYFTQSPTVGSLKVTFFWPFYGSYKIAYLDKNYQYALVLSDTNDYLWILSKTKTLDKKIIDNLLGIARDIGVDTAGVIYNSWK